MALTLFNSLTQKTEEFVPLNASAVGMYTCGPTVYDFVTIGNWRTYTLGDILARTLRYNGLHVTYVMNITDVGHLTGDNEGDASSGEDRMEKAKKREGKNAWDIAQLYTEDFKSGRALLNFEEPDVLPLATGHIKEQIELVQKLEAEGLVYTIDDGLYFDTQNYEAKGYKYGELSNLDHIKAGARVEMNPQKKNERDFALWKFSPKDEKRDMEWDSPWGVGFPGWHIECSAMSMKYLGEQFDLHLGGEDLKSTHHPNEIAQSQGATGKKPFVKYWLHGAFLQVDGGRMGKSLGNAYTLQDILAKNISPIALRYFYLGAHYRSHLNFTWDALNAAGTGLGRLINQFSTLGTVNGTVSETYKQEFLSHINTDLDMPQALALVWQLVKDDTVNDADKRATLLDFDRVLGFGLEALAEKQKKDLENVPIPVKNLALEREIARKAGNFARADELRAEIHEHGFTVEDSAQGPKILPR